MKSLRFLDRRIGFSLGALSLLLGVMAPAAIPAFASASTITSRSMNMSSSATGATNVSYKVNFTPATTVASGYVVLWFCSNTPLLGSTCNAPSGFNLSSASITTKAGTEAILTTGTDTYQGAGSNYVVWKNAALTASTAYSVTLGGVANPSAPAASFYGRIETFSTLADAKAAGGDTTNGGTANGTVITNMTDGGSVALATANTAQVSAAVLESLQFCLFGDAGNINAGGTGSNASDSSTYLSGSSSTAAGIINTNKNLYQLGYLTSTTLTNQAPGSNCSDSTAATYAGGASQTNGFVTPNVTLGDYVANNVYALNTSNVSYGVDWTQLDTNASGGAVVYLQSSNPCTGGGLSHTGGSTCDIPAQGVGGLVAGTAGFGVKVGTPASFDSVTTNDGTIAPNANYSGAYYLGSSTNSSSSPYGDAIYNTTSNQPATNWDVPIGLGATISPNTPAGNYTDTLSMIAVGTF